MSGKQEAECMTDPCLICLKVVTMQDVEQVLNAPHSQLYCDHSFHKECLAAWYRVRGEQVCPICSQGFHD